MAPSSRGQGHRPLTAKTRVRIPVGSLLAARLEAGFFMRMLAKRAGTPRLLLSLLVLCGRSVMCFFRGFARFFAYVPGLFPLSAVFFARFLSYRAGLLFAYLAGLLEPPVVSSSHQSPPNIPRLIHCSRAQSRLTPSRRR